MPQSSTERNRKYREKQRNNNPDWLSNQREYARAKYKKNPEKKRAQARQWRIKNPEKHMLIEAKRRAIRFGLEFNLETSDIVIPEKCPVFGFSLIRATGQANANEDSPSLDRIDSSKGYVKSNIRVISWRANRIKSDATVEDLEKVLAYMKNEISQHDLQIT